MGIITVLLIIALVVMLATQFAPSRPAWLPGVALAVWAILVSFILVGVV